MKTPPEFIVPTWASDRIAAICAAMDVSLQDFFGDGRRRDVVQAREVVAYILYDYTGHGGVTPSFPEVAAMMGRRGHKTVLDQRRRLAYDSARRDQADKLAAALGFRKRRPLAIGAPA